MIMQNLNTTINLILKSTPDPLHIRKTTASVVKDSKFVSTRQNSLLNLATILKDRISSQLLLTDSQFRVLNPTPQHIFIINSVNFCFWAKRGEKKWKVQIENKILDGWDALTACFARALKENIPIL